MSKVIVFIAGAAPDATELTLITAMGSVYDEVAVRSKLQDAKYGDTAEACDAVASISGVTIPTSHSGKTNVALKPLSFQVWPATKTIDLSNAETVQLVASARLPGETAEANVAAVTARVTYASSDAAKATVSSTGLVTPVGAGSTTITATYTDAHTNTMTDTCVITVQA